MPDQSLLIIATADRTSSAVSADGIAFIRKSIPTRRWVDVVFHNYKYVAIDDNVTSGMTNDGGYSWTLGVLPKLEFVDYKDGTPDIPLTSAAHLPIPTWSFIVFGAGLFIAFAQNTDKYATSVDGVTWTARTLPVIGQWVDCYWNGIKFILIQKQSGIIYNSTDGLTWSSQTVTIKIEDTDYPVDPSSITHSSDTWAMSTVGHDSFVLRSSDNGDTWIPTWINNDAISSTITCVNNEFLLLSNGNKTITSTYDTQEKIITSTFSSLDLIVWRLSPNGLLANQVAVMPANNKVHAVIPEDSYFYSTEHSRFVNDTVGTDSSLNNKSSFKPKHYYASTTVVSKSKISDHDQIDQPFAQSANSSTLFANRTIRSSYKLKQTADTFSYYGSTLITSRRSIEGRSTLGFDWNKRLLTEPSNWVSLAHNDSTTNTGYLCLSRDEIVAVSYNQGNNWSTYLMPTENHYNFSYGSSGNYIYSMSDYQKPYSTVVTNNFDATWHSGVLPNPTQSCLVVYAAGENTLYHTFDGANFKTVELS